MNHTEKSTQSGKRERLSVLLILLAIIILFAFFLKDNVLPLIRMQMRHDLNGAHQLLADRGLSGALSVILVEALQMVVVFIPAEFIQITSGLSYPLYMAIILCDLGVCLGATIIFFLVRYFKYNSSAFEKRKGKIERISAGMHERNTMLLLYLLFFMPLIPFGAICYYGSSTKLPYRKYILTVATGVLPSILVSNLLGTAGTAFLVKGLPLWQLIIVIIILAALLFALIFFFLRRFFFREADGTPDSMMYAFIFFIVRVWLGKSRHAEIGDELLHGVEAPYVVLVNHESFEDFYYISQMAHPKNPTYLVNEYYCTRPVFKTMAKQSGILSKKLFTRDMSTGIGILRMLRKGYPVVIFPEGRLSPDGRTNPIEESGAGLYKRFGVTVVLVKIDGAYYAHPKWRRKKYRSDLHAEVKRVIPPEELKDMTEEELDGVIRSTLYNDASHYEGARYPQKNKAAGLETLLYRCIDCGALYTTEGKGNKLRCTACGCVHTLDEHYRFTDWPGSIPGYYDEIRRMEMDELEGFSLKAAVRTKIFGAKGGPTRREEGECTLDEEFFRYSSVNESFEIPVEKLPALAFSCGKEFELYHNDELHYFYPVEDPDQVARWALMVDLMAERRNAMVRMKGENTNGKA